MYRKIMLNCIFGIGVVALLAAEAFGSHSNYPIGGTYLTKGVRCLYEATGTGSKPTVGICQIETDDALLQCINQGGNKPSETVALQIVVIGEGSAPGVGGRRGRSNYNVVNMFGTEPSDAECDASPACNELRQFCNSAQWVPTDLVPLTFCGTFSVFRCSSTAACPCDPDGVDGPLCLDHDATTPGVIDPLGPPDKVFCELPDPDTFQFGEVRPYNCVAATPQSCPDLF